MKTNPMYHIFEIALIILAVKVVKKIICDRCKITKIANVTNEDISTRSLASSFHIIVHIAAAIKNGTKTVRI